MKIKNKKIASLSLSRLDSTRHCDTQKSHSEVQQNKQKIGQIKKTKIASLSLPRLDSKRPSDVQNVIF